MTRKFLMLTLGPGTWDDPEGRIVVVEVPGLKVVDEIARKNGVFESTHKGICGASLCSSHPRADFVAVTEAEVVLGNLAPLRFVDEVTHPCFNDLHHVAYGNGEFAVANAGCESIEMLSPSLEFLRTELLIPNFRPSAKYCFSLTAEEIKRLIRRFRGAGGPSYQHLNRKRYFANVRKLIWSDWAHRGHDMRFQDMRPHFLHPNHVQYIDGDWAVTCFRPGSQVRLSDGHTMVNGLARPHDGVYVRDEVVFTESATSTITIRSRDAQYQRSFEVMPDGKAGFLRGIALCGDTIYAALSARRHRHHFPTSRVTAIEYDSGQIIETWALPRELGCQIYSVLDVTHAYET